MAIINLTCKQCGGNIIVDNSNNIGTCENCFAQYMIKEDKIVQNITKNITQNIKKYVIGIEGKDIEELIEDAYKLLDLGNRIEANRKFKKAIDINPDCWSAWLGYASTGGRNDGYISMVPAYIEAYNVAKNEEEEIATFVDMTRYLPDSDLRAAFVRAYNVAPTSKRHTIFKLVSRVIGCDESEIANLAVDICPNDWRAYFAMSKFRLIRARWCELEGSIFFGKHLPTAAQEVLDLFLKTYQLAKNENEAAKNKVLNYVKKVSQDNSYKVFTTELLKQMY